MNYNLMLSAYIRAIGHYVSTQPNSKSNEYSNVYSSEGSHLYVSYKFIKDKEFFWVRQHGKVRVDSFTLRDGTDLTIDQVWGKVVNDEILLNRLRNQLNRVFSVIDVTAITRVAEFFYKLNVEATQCSDS